MGNIILFKTLAKKILLLTDTFSLIQKYDIFPINKVFLFYAVCLKVLEIRKTINNFHLHILKGIKNEILYFSVEIN